MKKNIMIIVALLLSVECLTAQDTVARGYQSFFGSESTVWYACEEYLDAWMYATRKFVIDRDTAVDGIGYKVFSAYDVYPFDIYQESIDSFHSGIIREDTATGKLWLRSDATNGEEKLLIDMSLSAGDTIVYNNNYGQTILVVNSVFIDSMGRKVIELDDGYRAIYFIEGIGTSEIIGNVGYGFTNHMICIFHNDTITHKYYGLSQDYVDYDNCRARYRETIFMPNKEGAAIYPNPCTETININIEDLREITLYDITGRKIKNTMGECTSFDMSQYDRGMYILETTMKNKRQSRIIIKN